MWLADILSLVLIGDFLRSSGFDWATACSVHVAYIGLQKGLEGGGGMMKLMKYQPETRALKFVWRQVTDQKEVKSAILHSLDHVSCYVVKLDNWLVISLVYTRVLTRIQPEFASSVNAPNPDCNPG